MIQTTNNIFCTTWTNSPRDIGGSSKVEVCRIILVCTIFHEVVTAELHPSGKLKKTIVRVVYAPMPVDNCIPNFYFLSSNNFSTDSHPEY